MRPQHHQHAAAGGECGAEDSEEQCGAHGPVNLHSGPRESADRPKTVMTAITTGKAG